MADNKFDVRCHKDSEGNTIATVLYDGSRHELAPHESASKARKLAEEYGRKISR